MAASEAAVFFAADVPFDSFVTGRLGSFEPCGGLRFVSTVGFCGWYYQIGISLNYSEIFFRECKSTSDRKACLTDRFRLKSF